MNKKSIAAQLYTIREFLKTPEDIEKSLKRVRDIGYEAVQVSGMGPIDPLELKRITEELGLAICITHTPYDRFVNDLDNVIKEHKLWNCEYVGIGSMPTPYRADKEGYLRFASEFSEIGRKLAQHGLKFSYHNHRFEFEKFDGKTGMDLLMENSTPDNFALTFDTYWIQAGGASPAEWIRKTEGRIGVVHLKDMAIKNDTQVFAEVGQGNMNWPEIIEACRSTGVKWYAVEQDVCATDPFECLETSFRYLEKFL